jgi:hypothetical protein
MYGKDNLFSEALHFEHSEAPKNGTNLNLLLSA